jgi:hypothetical protein
LGGKGGKKFIKKRKVKIMASPVQDRIRQDSNNQKLWWNRPLFGDQSLLQRLKNWWKGIFFQALVPDSSVLLYKDSFTQLRNISAIAKNIDNEKFSSQEFLTFLKINSAVKNNQGEYEGLKYTIDLLRVALETKDCFLQIEQIESRYFSYSQQEFYQFIFELLERELTKDEFKELVQRELSQTIPKIKTDEGKTALQSYSNQLDILSEDQLGLKLLFLFKQYNLTDFSLLRTVAEIADSFYDKSLESLKEFTVIVRVNTEIFLKLGEIIKVPKQKNNPQTYALILQYIALRNRHKGAFGQFKQLINLLKQWEQFYEPIMAIRREYPPTEYKQPPIFREELPGFSLYQKYQQYLETEI